MADAHTRKGTWAIREKWKRALNSSSFFFFPLDFLFYFFGHAVGTNTKSSNCVYVSARCTEFQLYATGNKRCLAIANECDGKKQNKTKQKMNNSRTASRVLRTMENSSQFRLIRDILRLKNERLFSFYCASICRRWRNSKRIIMRDSLGTWVTSEKSLSNGQMSIRFSFSFLKNKKNLYLYFQLPFVEIKRNEIKSLASAQPWCPIQPNET